MDFYSQRLRLLAGATSPNPGTARKMGSSYAGPSSTEPSPSKASSETSLPKEPVPTTSSSTGANNSGEGQHQSASPASSGKDVSSGGPDSPNLKSCEFCGKSFRFMSNLIVHRRSHTGEKPYKCHICQHACTQASKLKRHMKTHRSRGASKLSPGSQDNTSLESGRSTPEKEVTAVGLGERVSNGNDSDTHTNGDYDEDVEDDDEEMEDPSDEEEDEEEEAELAGDEEEEEEEEEEEQEQEDEAELTMAEDLSTPRGAKSSSPVRSSSTPVQASPNDKSEDEVRKQESHESPPSRKSLLGEVMEKIGLTDIQQYNDAYKQALQESFSKGSGVKTEQKSMLEGALVSNGPDGSKTIGQPALEFSHSLLRAFDKRSPFDSKRPKVDDLYAGMWLPSLSHRDFFTETSDRHRSSSSSESALTSVSPGCRLGSGALSPRPGTSGGKLLSSSSAFNGTSSAKGPKGDRRSDTCEYCGKIFKNCSNLTVHRRSHTGEKPYKCGLCSYACAQSSKLTRHMKTHGRLGKDVFRCRFCDMPFSVPSTLEKHMRKCVVTQSPGTNNTSTNATSLTILDKDSDSKEMT